ncbi:hypothetical protein [Celerinatantimonas sp. YJH-8]|uniref:AbiTii domain-containing protein n=1 Tax=Celerinatantimonas sp. YJH-8 TaxID=3228714 RepID=UPI0038C44EDD
MSVRSHINVQRDAYIRELLECCLSASEINQNQGLKQWLTYEQNSYPDQVPLPRFRMVDCRQQGLFIDPENQHQHLEYIHDNTLPARHRCQLHYMAMRQPLCQYIEMSQVIRTPWPEEILCMYSHELIPGMHCLQAWQVIDNPPVSRMLAGMLHELWERLAQSPDLFEQLDPLICQLGEHYPAINPLWGSRPQHQQTTVESDY